MSVVAVGNSDFIAAFELLGAYGFRVEEGEVRETLRKLLEDERFKLIILPEEFTKITSEMRMEVLKKSKTYPIFIIVPALKGEAKGERLRELKTLISFAVGVELK